MNRFPQIAIALICFRFLAPISFAQQNVETHRPRRNAIIFVADGLRPSSVNQQDTPTLWRIKSNGVYFPNSHSLFPTFTTANASAIATGHGLGDTGDFSNTIWAGYGTFDSGNFELPPSTPTPFVENNQILSDLAAHYGGNYLHEQTILSAAQEAGYNVASIGKQGPVAIQSIESIAAKQRRFPLAGQSLIVDDATGTPAGVPISAEIMTAFITAGLSAEAPTRSNGYGPASDWNNGYAGNSRRHGTLQANIIQQDWFVNVTTQVVLPRFAKDLSQHPFLLVFWSRDPDGSQHNQGDSLNSFFPGVNGDTSRLGIQNADRDLKRILDWLDANPEVKSETDIFVTSDHGFATVSRREISRTGRQSKAESAQHYYLDSAGAAETDQGILPSGFLAIDLAVGLHTNLFDPDRHSAEGVRGPFRQVRLNPELFEHPVNGNGLIGYTVEQPDGSDATAIVAANGGSDLIYVPDKNQETVKRIVVLLTTFDYVGAIFVDDQYCPVPGALPLSSIGLVGDSPMPRPAIVVAFKVFNLNPNEIRTAVQVSDTNLQIGQGIHGGFGRDSTLNFMAAIGPDFKMNFEDKAPVSNTDIAPTIARIFGLEFKSNGKLKGRVINESLRGEPDAMPSSMRHIASAEAGGMSTVLFFQEVQGMRYMDAACFIEKSEEVTKGSTCPQ